MSSANITPQQILEATQRVPEERWPAILQVIDGLQRESASELKSLSPVRIGTDLRDSELIGIWADRTDFVDSREFARGLRREAERGLEALPMLLDTQVYGRHDKVVYDLFSAVLAPSIYAGADSTPVTTPVVPFTGLLAARA